MVNEWSDLLRISLGPSVTLKPLPRIAVEAVEKITGHRFKQPLVLCEALVGHFFALV